MFIAKPFDQFAAIDDVFPAWFEIMRGKGVVMAGYHLMPAHGSPVGRRVIVRNFGFPEGFAQLYDTVEFRSSDPIPVMVFEAGRPKRWDSIFGRGKFTAAEKEFIGACAHYGLIDGVSMPLYGPNGREGYLSMSFGRPLQRSDVTLSLELQAVAQAAHVRISKLLEADFMANAQLSARERTVLDWLARGKSNSEIAVIMNLSANTIDTYTRRIYAKLQINDRIAAVVVGLTHGLIKF